MATNNVAAIRKRAQIHKANRTMFLWIAVCSALVGASLVVSFFLAQKLFYNEKILFEKNKTIGILEANNKIVPELQSAIRVLDTNEDLAKVKASEDDQAIQVILDALPSEANSLAVGASLQSRLLAGVEGLRVESMQVDPVAGIESLNELTVVDASTTGTEGVVNQITFQFSVVGPQEALRKVLENLERSIRQIDVQGLRIESQGATQIMTVTGRAYFEPAKSIELTDKVVPR